MNATFPLISAPGKSFSAESVQEMWRMVLDALRDPVFLHDRNFCITRANRAYVSRAGVGFRELIGKPYWQVFPKSTGPHRSCIQAMANPSGPELDEIIEYDGSSFLSRSIPVTNVSGEYLYSLHIMEDISPLRQSATMVNRSEEQFRLVSEAIAEVFWMADISLERIYYVSPGYEQIWGRSRTDLYRNPRTFVDAIHPADRQCVLTDLEDQKTGQAFDHVCRVIAPDETVRWIWNRGFPLADDGGHYSRYLGVALDITQRIQAETGLLESNRRLEEIQSAMDQAGIAIQWVDADSGRFIYINERCCDMLGYSREALLTLSIPDIDPNFSKTKGEFGALTAPLRKQGAGRLETVNLHKDGHPIPIEASFHFRESPNGEKHFITFVVDISRRKQAEVALKRESDQNSAMAALASALLAVGLSVNALSKIVMRYAKQLTLSEQGYVSIIDPRNGDNVAYDLTEMMGSDCLIAGDDNKIAFPIGADGRYSGLWGHALNTRQGFFTNEPGKHEAAQGLPAGHMPLRNFLSVPAIAGDRLVGQLALANAPHDYTDEDMEIARHLTDLFAIALERLHAEETILQLNQTLEQRVAEEVAKNMEHERLLIQQSRLAAMGEMVHNIAHQWRQPLNTVGLILQNIALDYEENLLTSASLHEYAENGKALVQEMSVTIDDFRDFFTPQREKMVFSLRQAIDSALNIVHASFLNHGIAIDFDGGADARAVGYPNECSQVLLNLLSNAKEAILERNIRGGRIAIALGQDEQSVWVSVKDNGGGIAEDILPKIFDPYFTTKKKGTGIGLYMSKMIMNHMGGGITIRNVEGGAEVLLKLPLSVN